MSDINRFAVQTFYENVHAGNFPAATAVFDENLTWVEPPFPGFAGGTFHGKDNILKNVLGVFLATWTELTVTPESVSPSGDRVFVLGRYRGKNRVTQVPFEARFVHTWTFQNGKAVRFEMLADTIQFFRTVESN